MPMGWASADSELCRVVIQQSEACLRVYREDPSRIEEDAAIELSYSEGGYQRSQLFELMQNATDALRGTSGRIHIVLTSRALYVANEGQPFTERGATTVLASHLSRKAEEDIGQFGLGFKSVLAVTHRPTVYSRSGSFAFEREWAEAQIRNAGLTSSRYPVLRLARPVDPRPAADADSVLRELMQWASTVIHLPIHRDREHLASSLASFPAEFMLFAPQVSELRLDDREAGEHRVVRLHRDGEQLRLVENENTSSWTLVQRKHSPTAPALRDAGELAQRSAITVSWAIPLDGKRRNAVGEFWAHFPTGLRTTLGGIVNAPWKLSADRLSMLDGMYNRELLVGVLPDVVRDALPRLGIADDPGSVIDLLPARGREPRSWGDGIINEPIYEVIARARSLPDRTGELRHPVSLSLQPKDLPSEWLGAWSPQNPHQWVHESVDATTERRAKAERIIGLAEGRNGTFKEWIEAMVTDRTPASSARAIRLAAMISRMDRERNDQIRSARIVLLEDGTLGVPIRGQVFLRADDRSSGHRFLHPELINQPDLSEAFATLGIEILDRAGELRAALQRGPKVQEWGPVWALIDQIDAESAWAIINEEVPAPLTDHVFARTRSGKWRPLDTVFLPGDVIPVDSRNDTEYAVDPSLHTRHIPLLERCGAVAAPRLIRGLTEPWLDGFKLHQAERYQEAMRGSRPSLEYVVVEGPDIPWPLELLPVLSLTARAAITNAALRLGTPDPWKVSHKTRPEYPPKTITSPLVHRLFRYGVLPTTVGPAETQLCLHPEADVPDVFPKAEVTRGWASLLRLPMDLTHWEEESWALFINDAENRRPESAASIYASAAAHGIARPTHLLASITPHQATKRAADSVAVTNEQEVARSLLLAGIPAIRVDSDLELQILVEKWGLADGRDMLKEQIVPVPDSDPVLLLDKFPPLRLYESQIPDLDTLEIQTCSAIDIFVSTPQGQQARRTEHHRDGTRLLVENGADPEVIGRISAVLEVPLNADNILGEMARQAMNATVRSVRSKETIPEKLVAAIGADALRRHVPGTAITDLEVARHASLTPVEVAELALAVHGYDVLKELRGELADAGLQPPSRWAGGAEARKFVETLDFPPEYAGFPGTSLSAVLEVEGPVSLPKLHDYQQQVVDRIHDLLTTPREERRGMVTLPTGAGKTRVAVEAVVRLAAEEKLRGSVLWIAQTEELCEQAVQAWSYVWRAIGNGPMQVSRFWSQNSAEETGYGVFHVIVCTIAKLQNAVGDARYEWLKRAGLIIVDEAHGAITTSYTQVLSWLGGERTVSSLQIPLIGLTATAFRGTSETETDRLVSRFGANRLDAGIFGEDEPYEYLQRMGILANVRQKTLEGMDIEIREQDLKQLQQMRRLSRETESLVGQNSHRNGVILDSLIDQPDDWTTLLFATSVEHANAMAAELSYYDVTARPIHAGTDPALRRRYIEQFREGDLRVLTNYGVLAQGFDAPRVQAVYVTRPTFSPNLYQQMIGRGLRGPLNGGSEEVLIVNVDDNLVQFGDQLAFHHFDYLWNKEA